MKAVFPDTCVFIDFAGVGRLDILQFVVKTNDIGPDQCKRRSRPAQPITPPWPTFRASCLPLIPTVVELQHALLLKDTFFDEAGDPKSAQLGECELIAVAEGRFGADKIMVLTRDKKLIAFCSQESNNFVAVTTTQILEVADKA